jgi:hypothetical protein
MTEAASLRGDGGGTAASGGVVASLPPGEVSMAWTRACGSEEKVELNEGLAAVICNLGARFLERRRHSGHGREVSMAWARRETTTTAWRSMWVSKGDDNYGGGGDNYPRVVKMRAEGRECVFRSTSPPVPAPPGQPFRTTRARSERSDGLPPVCPTSRSGDAWMISLLSV